jgi:hypothetical protein
MPQQERVIVRHSETQSTDSQGVACDPGAGSGVSALGLGRVEGLQPSIRPLADMQSHGRASVKNSTDQ